MSETQRQWRAMGLYFGYPQCCIDAFVEEEGVKIPGNLTGFVPCKTHARLIQTKKKNIIDLIKDRKCELPFPEQPKLTPSLLKSILADYDAVSNK